MEGDEIENLRRQMRSNIEIESEKHYSDEKKGLKPKRPNLGGLGGPQRHLLEIKGNVNQEQQMY